MNLPKLPAYYIDEVVVRALNEDINYIDVTTDWLIGEEKTGSARLIAKADGVLAGLSIAARTFELVGNATMQSPLKDGDFIKSGAEIAEISGNAASMLKAERTALNFLQHMSGIATYTKKCVEAAKSVNPAVSIADTRKTLPGLRALQKYAVLCGDGNNHRYNLSAAALIKDNHIDACGSVANAISAVRERAGHAVALEVEVRDFSELEEALGACPDIIMLDNMSLAQMEEAVKLVRAYADKRGVKKPKLEASGNVSLDNIAEIAKTGIDIISLGALTHSVKAFDVSMKWGK